MDKTNIEKLMIAQIASGIVANPCIFSMYREEIENGKEIEDCIIRDAKLYVSKILDDDKEELMKSEFPKRAQTGLYDATGKQILDGDIIVYTKWWTKEDLDNISKILDDIIPNYSKYDQRISLHPVWWDEDIFTYCTDVYGDCDPLYKIEPKYMYVVSNKHKNPDYYNH
jgi:hypothetical protein